MRLNGSVFRINDMIGNEDVKCGSHEGSVYRAVPNPFRGGLFCRLKGAIEVVRGRSFAVDWPKPGELERALDK